MWHWFFKCFIRTSRWPYSHSVQYSSNSTWRATKGIFYQMQVLPTLIKYVEPLWWIIDLKWDFLIEKKCFAKNSISNSKTWYLSLYNTHHCWVIWCQKRQSCTQWWFHPCTEPFHRRFYQLTSAVNDKYWHKYWIQDFTFWRWISQQWILWIITRYSGSKHSLATLHNTILWMQTLSASSQLLVIPLHHVLIFCSITT